MACSPTANGGTLVKGVCVRPAGNVGRPHEAFTITITSANAGGTFSIVSGSLPPGPFMPAGFGAPGTIAGGTPAQQGSIAFTVAGLDTAGHHLRPAYRVTIDPPPPLTIVLPAGGSTRPDGTAGVPSAQDFFLSGRAAPRTWPVAAGTLPPGPGPVATAAPPATTTSGPARRPPRARSCSPWR